MRAQPVCVCVCDILCAPLQKHACVPNAHAALAGERHRLQPHLWTRVGQQGKAERDSAHTNI